MTNKRTELRQMAKHIIAEEIIATVEGGLPMDTWAEMIGVREETLRKEVMRQAFVLRKASERG